MKTLKHPATVIAVVALFAAFGGGGIAYASGLISGSQIKNHSIPVKKLTASAIKSLRGQRGVPGPGAISLVRGNVPADSTSKVLTTIGGIKVFYACDPSGVVIGLARVSGVDTVFASGDSAVNGSLTAVQTSGAAFEVQGSSTANLDVIAWAGSIGILSRFDLGAFANGTNACNIWGLITPGSP
jgi:hypothetical protein